MLRIAPPQGPPPPGPPTDGPPGPPPDAGGGGLPPQLLAMLGQGGGGGGMPPPKYDTQKTTQEISGYLGPESGPFACGNCIHFEDPGSCGLVAGAIDPQGCCNLFESGNDQGAPDDAGGEPPPEGDPGVQQ